ncbi:effector binding domain-containing protein [Paenibacillus sp. 32O-W]|uniref:effector binding domain-containing protein n=1 Tax=Paenibacillus sp. 32O-W TaxID=1695218 RepID=UPI0021B6C5F9|nr:effector binding domain-containing protein [Paenibacillus sp. 32O-W]
MITIYDWFGYELPIKERYQLIKEAGFDGVLLWWSEDFNRNDYRSGPQIAREAGLFIENIHTPIKNQNSLWLDNLEGEDLHGLTPTTARNAGSQLKAYPRISFQIILKGVVGMNYRIEKRDAFQVYGLEDIYNYDDIANQQGISIPEVWQNIGKNGEFDRLRKSVTGDWWHEGNFSKELGAVFAYDSYKFTSNTTFPYLIGCYKSENSKVNGYTVVDVPASTWAVFSTLNDGNGSGNYDLRSLKNRIFSEWLPTSNFNVLDGGNFEMYCTDKDGYEYCELWYRIEEKQIG